MSKNSSFKETRSIYDHKFVYSENPGQNIWHKVKKSSKIGQDLKNLLSNFACFLAPIVKASFLEGRLGASLRLHPNLTFF